MANTTTTELASIIEKRVSMVVTETLEQESVSLGVVKNYSGEVGQGMDRLDIPLFGLLSVQDVNEASGVTPEASSVSTALLNLNRHKAISWALSVKANIQMKVSVIDANVKNGARTLAAEIDDFIYGAMVTAKGGASLEVDAADPIKAIREAKERMDQANIPKSGRYITAGPGFMQLILGDSNVINADKYGNASGIQAGFVTDLYGFRIVESSSSSIPANGFIANHEESFAFARQLQPRLDRQFFAARQAEDYVLSHLYGGVATDSGSERIIVAEDLV
jgi:hypothetical protein